MTRQILSKINAERYGFMLERLKGSAQSDSELIAQCVFHAYVYNFVHFEQLNGLTMRQAICKQMGINEADGKINFWKAFHDYSKRSHCNSGCPMREESPFYPNGQVWCKKAYKHN